MPDDEIKDMKASMLNTLVTLRQLQALTESKIAHLDRLIDKLDWILQQPLLSQKRQ